MVETFWSDALKMDVEPIDDQHRRSFELLQEMRQSMRDRQNRRVTLHRMQYFCDYMTSHAKAEESLMHEYGYPRLVEHKRRHVELMGVFNQFCERMQNERAIITFDSIDELSQRLREHIELYDLRYRPFVQQTGLRCAPPPLAPPTQNLGA